MASSSSIRRHEAVQDGQGVRKVDCVGDVVNGDRIQSWDQAAYSSNLVIKHT